MAAPHGLDRKACCASFAVATLMWTLLSTAGAEPSPPLERLSSAPDASRWRLALIPPFSSRIAPPVLIDDSWGGRFVVGRRSPPAFSVGYLDLPLIPARGAGMFAFVGTSTQSLGGFRLRF